MKHSFVNGSLTLTLDDATGRYDCVDLEAGLGFQGARAELEWQGRRVRGTDSAYSRRVVEAGPSVDWVFESGQRPRFTLRFTPVKAGAGFVAELDLGDLDSAGRVGLLSPLVMESTGRGRASKGPGPIDIALPGAERDRRFYRLGYQSWSPSGSLAVTTADRDTWFRAARLATLDESTAPTGVPGRFMADAMGMIAGRDEHGDGAILLGFVTGADQRSHIHFEVDPATGSPATLAACSDGEGVPLGRLGRRGSEALFIGIGRQPYELAEQYADALGQRMLARVFDRRPTAWCSWYEYYTKITEEALLGDLDHAASGDPIDYEVFQIDDGYTLVGDWLDTNKDFPRGLKDLAGRIVDRGLTPGLWVAPFYQLRKSRIVRSSKHWLLRNRRGRILNAGMNPLWQLSPLYALDPTHPEVLAWLHEVFSTLRGWGFGYFKIDFLYTAALKDALYRDRHVTRAQALRRTLEVIRGAVGEEAIIEGCGCPLLPAVGVVDAMRIAPDVDPDWDPLVSRVLRSKGAPSTKSSIRTGLSRIFLNDRLWSNHLDCVMVRDRETKMSPVEVRTLTTAIVVNGGLFVHSDRLEPLSDEARETLRRINPLLRGGFRPVDFPMEEVASTYFRTIRTGHGEWTLAAVFNFTDRPKAVDIDFGKLGLDVERHYEAFEFWERRYLGKATGRLEVGTVPPHGCALLKIAEATGGPSFLATDRHYSMGAVEVESAAWRSGALTLRLPEHGIRKSRIYLLIPETCRDVEVVDEEGPRSFRRAGPLLTVPLESGHATEIVVRVDR